MIMFCFVKARTLYMYGCMYFLAAFVLVCVDVMVVSYAYPMTRTGDLCGNMYAV